MVRHYNKEKHECSNCGMLMDEESFKYHEEKICMGIWFKNKILKDEVERYGIFNNQGVGI